MTRAIGYYVHHHGAGHLARAMAIATCERDRYTLIGTGLAGRTKDIACLDLPDDRMPCQAAFDGRDGVAERPHALHYAPTDQDGIRSRISRIAAWIEQATPGLIVVDVSVEIAMLARLAATPTAYVRLGGRRDDAAHHEAFRGARLVIAPFHEALDDPETPDWLRAKTRYCPGLTAAGRADGDRKHDTVLVVYGKGGAGPAGHDLAAAARATPDLDWMVLGGGEVVPDCPGNLHVAGWVDDADARIATAGVVIGGAGDGLVNAVLAAGAPFICLPEPRPFQEQESKARRLAALGVAIVPDGWPPAADWAGLIGEARALDPAAAKALHDPDGAARASKLLARVADGGPCDAD